MLDNLNLKVLANFILKNHRNSDMHWIGHFATIDKVPSDELNNSNQIVANIIKDFSNILMLVLEERGKPEYLERNLRKN